MKPSFDGRNGSVLLGLVFLGTYFGKMLGHALFVSPQGNSRLLFTLVTFTLIFLALPEVNKEALNLALLFSNHFSPLTEERKYIYFLFFRAVTLYI